MEYKNTAKLLLESALPVGDMEDLGHLASDL